MSRSRLWREHHCSDKVFRYYDIDTFLGRRNSRFDRSFDRQRLFEFLFCIFFFSLEDAFGRKFLLLCVSGDLLVRYDVLVLKKKRSLLRHFVEIKMYEVNFAFTKPV